MKRKYSLLLSTLLLAACGSVNDSSPLNSDINSSFENLSSNGNSSSNVENSSIIDSSSIEDSSSPSESITESSSDQQVNEQIHNEKNMTHFLGSDNDVFRININTVNNEFPVDKENYVDGTLNITEQDSNVVIQDTMDMRIKLRGNSTLGAAKKPFKVKFDSKQSLFGLKKSKDWVLLANYYDKSNIRNYLAYLTANKMSNLDFQPSSIFVDVYFNNEYYGLFLLCEQMEVNSGRVDVEDNISNEGINSFLIEADERAKDEYAGYQGYAYVSSGGYDFALKYPDADDYIEALELQNSEDFKEKEEAQAIVTQHIKDVTWLQSFLNDVSTAIYSADGSDEYEKYVDVDSFIDFYLVQEMFKNLDVGSTSQYYIIDQAQEIVKLQAGPVWDFDLATGVVDKTSSSIYSHYSSTDLYVRERDYYIKALFENQSFAEKVSQRYTEIRDDVILSIFKEYDLICDLLEKAQKRNIERWPLTQERDTWVEIYALSEYYYYIPTLAAHLDHVKTTLDERLKIMDEAYLIK